MPTYGGGVWGGGSPPTAMFGFKSLPCDLKPNRYRKTMRCQFRLFVLPVQNATLGFPRGGAPQMGSPGAAIPCFPPLAYVSRQFQSSFLST